MSSQDGLEPRDLDDLIGRLSRRKQESPTTKIPYEDVKDILQEEGLLEALVQEYSSSRERSIATIEQKNRNQRSWLLKGFAALSALIAGGSGYGGYTVANKISIDNKNQSVTNIQNTYNEQSKTLAAKITELESELKTKDSQIEELKSKVSAAPTSVSNTITPASNGSQSINVPTATASGSSNNFEFGSSTFQGCTRADKAVKCAISIVSKTDRLVEVGSCSSDTKTRIFDPQGVEYKANAIEFGKDLDNSGCTVRTSVLKDIPVKAVLTFDKVPSDVKSLKAMEVSIGISEERKGAQWQFAQYRDITIK